MSTVTHLKMAELEQKLDEIRNAPQFEGRLELIVKRPAFGGERSSR